MYSLHPCNDGGSPNAVLESEKEIK
jgi:hypothetical protein